MREEPPTNLRRSMAFAETSKIGELFDQTMGGTLSGFKRSLYEDGLRQVVRFGDRMAVKVGGFAPVELYDLKADPAEAKNIAAGQPALVARATKLMTDARDEHPDWKLHHRPTPKKK